jgi:hypothetical protein
MLINEISLHLSPLPPSKVELIAVLFVTDLKKS